jgi:hypothetical protein
VFFEAFMTFTVIVFAFGPWDWPVTNPVTLYSFLFINQLALLFGYVTAVRGRLPSYFHISLTINQLVWPGTVVTLLLFVPTVKYATGGDIDIARAFSDPGAAYNATRQAVSFSGSNLVYIIRLLLSPLIWPLMPLTVVYWKKLSSLSRVLAILAIAGEAFVNLLIGTNSPIVNILILIPWLLILRSKSPKDILEPKKVIQFFLLFGLACSIFLPYFGRNIAGRSSSGMIMRESIRGGPSVNPETIRILGFDNPLANAYSDGITALSSYIGQGYYGLSLSLQEPTIFTYGIGHSRALTEIVEKFIGKKNAITNLTYEDRIDRDYGWTNRIHWSSLYPWLANDLTFIGVPFLIFLFGKLLGNTWLDAIGGNYIAVVLFCLVALTIYYVSASAVVFQAYESVFVFYLYLFWWIQSRIKRNRQFK